MNDLFSIMPDEGLGTLRFGASFETVRAYLGEPSRIEQSARPSFLSKETVKVVQWRYREPHLSISFEEDHGDYQAYEFHSDDPRMRLLGLPLIDQPFKETLRQIEHRGLILENEAVRSYEIWLIMSQGVTLFVDTTDREIMSVTWRRKIVLPQ